MSDGPHSTALPSEFGLAEDATLRAMGGPLLDVVMGSPGGLLVVDGRGIVMFANPAAAQVLARRLEELAGLPFGLPLLAGGASAELDVVLPGHRRAVVEMEVSSISWFGEEARLVTLRDVTERVTAQRRLKLLEERHELYEAAVDDGIWDWSRDPGLVHTSARLPDMLGLPPSEGEDDPALWLSRIHLDDLPGLQRAAREHAEGRTPRLQHEVRLRSNDGSWLWVLVRGLAVRDADRVVRYAGSVRDISERKLAEGEMRDRALHDPLTGLANRALILDHLHGAIERQRRQAGSRFAVLFLDLDHFKDVNDSYGHAAGDALLVEVGHRIERSVRATDKVGRLGGDEFVVMLEAPVDSDTVLKTAERIREALARPISLGRELTHTTASIGVLLGAEFAEDPEAVLDNADAAMYLAKVHGRDGYQVYTRAMGGQADDRLQLRAQLRAANTSGDLFVRYQPTVALTDGRITGFEALLRWRREGGQVLDAASFIDVAEQIGILPDAGWSVLSAACRQASNWRAAGYRVKVAVNLADEQVSAPDLSSRVHAALVAEGVDGSDLQLEISERIAMTRVDEAVQQLRACREMGVEVLVDGFGTGYSSLSVLHRLPLTALKIDRSFVGRLDGDADAGAVVRAILTLAGALGMDAIAQGVETAEQRDHLRSLGCRVGQGYLYGPAVDAEEATRLLHDQPPAWRAEART